jgi:hypothetical protein
MAKFLTCGFGKRISNARTKHLTNHLPQQNVNWMKDWMEQSDNLKSKSLASYLSTKNNKDFMYNTENF